MAQLYRGYMMKIMKSASLCFTLLLLFTVLTAAASYHEQLHGGSPEAKISITGKEHPFGFLPALLTVYVNQKIVFVNNANPPASYQVVAENNAFTSPVIAPGQQWILQMSTAGQYEYSDPAFKQQMVGELNVVPLSTQLLPPSNPQAEATAIADLKSSQSTHSSQIKQSSQPQGLPPFLLAGSIIVFIMVAGSVLILTRRGHSRKS